MNTAPLTPDFIPHEWRPLVSAELTDGFVCGGRRQPLTLRAFYPVRTAPTMARHDIPRAHESLRVFAEVARDPRNGARHLRGCYADHDDLHSRLRVLRRGRNGDQAGDSDTNQPSPTHEVPA